MYQAIGAYATSADGTLVFGLPDGVESGDLLIAFFNITANGQFNAFGTANGWDASSGWDSQGNVQYFSENGRVAVFTRIADETSLDTLTVTHNNWATTISSDPSALMQGQMILVSGQHASDPFVAPEFFNDGTHPINHPSVTAVADGSLCLLMAGGYLTFSGSYTMPSGFTIVGQNPSGDVFFYIAHNTVNAGATGGLDVTTSTNFFRGGAVTMVITPAEVGGGGGAGLRNPVRGPFIMRAPV